MKKCDKCLFPETYETIVYNEKNECNICASNLKQKRNKLEYKKKELDKIISNYRENMTTTVLFLIREEKTAHFNFII